MFAVSKTISTQKYQVYQHNINQKSEKSKHQLVNIRIYTKTEQKNPKNKKINQHIYITRFYTWFRGEN